MDATLEHADSLALADEAAKAHDRRALEAVVKAYLPRVAAFDPSTTAGGIEPTHVSVVGAWGIAGLALALRTFRRAPRSTS